MTCFGAVLLPKPFKVNHMLYVASMCCVPLSVLGARSTAVKEIEGAHYHCGQPWDCALILAKCLLIDVGT